MFEVYALPNRITLLRDNLGRQFELELIIDL